MWRWFRWVLLSIIVVLIGLGTYLIITFGGVTGALGSIGIGNKYAGDWNLSTNFEFTHSLAGASQGKMTGSGNVKITISKDKNNKVTGEGNWEAAYSGESYTGMGASINEMAKGKIAISGNIEGNKLIFTDTWTSTDCPAVVNVGGYGTLSVNDCPTPGTGKNREIEMKDGAKLEDSYTLEGGAQATQTWVISRECKDKIPEIKKEVERLLDNSVNTNETPEQIHQKLMNLIAERFPVGKSFSERGKCLEVIGYSVDLQYKIGTDENSIFKTVGSTSGQDHRIINATLDKTNSGTQKYYKVTIDVSLNGS